MIDRKFIAKSAKNVFEHNTKNIWKFHSGTEKS